MGFSRDLMGFSFWSSKIAGKSPIHGGFWLGKTSRSWVFSIANYFLVNNIDVETLDASQLKDFQYKVSPTSKGLGHHIGLKLQLLFQIKDLKPTFSIEFKSSRPTILESQLLRPRLFRCRTGSRNRPSCCRSPAIPTNWRRRWPEIQPGSGKKQLPQSTVASWQFLELNRGVRAKISLYTSI